MLGLELGLHLGLGLGLGRGPSASGGWSGDAGRPWQITFGHWCCPSRTRLYFCNKFKEDSPAFSMPSQNGFGLNSDMEDNVHSDRHHKTSTKQNVKLDWLLCFFRNIHRCRSPYLGLLIRTQTQTQTHAKATSSKKRSFEVFLKVRFSCCSSLKLKR